MTKIRCNFTITREYLDILRRRSAEEHRSMSSHIEHLIEQDAQGFVNVPVRGFIDDAGNIQYFETPEEKDEK